MADAGQRAPAPPDIGGYEEDRDRHPDDVGHAAEAEPESKGTETRERILAAAEDCCAGTASPRPRWWTLRVRSR